MRKKPKRIGLAIVGAGRVGLIRSELAARHPEVDWIGLAEINPERGEIVREKCGADFVTTDFRELLSRPEVNAVIVSTDEHLHVDPVVFAAERKLPMLIEKPLATDLGESASTLAAIESPRIFVTSHVTLSAIATGDTPLGTDLRGVGTVERSNGGAINDRQNP